MEKRLTVEELKELLELHSLWLKKSDKGRRLDLSRQDLRDPEIVEILKNANLRYANLYGANLYGANLSDANLYNANLCNAVLCNANLCNANLRNANLKGAKNIPYIRLACPDTGSFIGWKKVYDYIIKLEIPSEAKRCSATTNKCRCEFAKVLEIQNEDGSIADINEIVNDSYNECIYKVGEMVYPDSFDENRWNECSNGIHFFINRQEAVDY